MLDSNRNGFLERSELLRNIFPDEYVKHTQQISDETLGRSRLGGGAPRGARASLKCSDVQRRLGPKDPGYSLTRVIQGPF